MMYILLSLAILGLAVNDGIYLIKQGLKKEIFIYSFLLIVSIILEFLALNITAHKSLALFLINIIGKE